MFDKSDIAPLRASLPSDDAMLPTKSPDRQKQRSLKKLRSTVAGVSGEATVFKPPATDAGTKIALLPKNNAELTHMLHSSSTRGGLSLVRARASPTPSLPVARAPVWGAGSARWCSIGPGCTPVSPANARNAS